MEMNSVTSGITTWQTGYTTKVDKNTSNSDAVSKTADKAYSGESATYEKGSIEPKATYSINKMSKEERAANRARLMERVAEANKHIIWCW